MIQKSPRLSGSCIPAWQVYQQWDCWITSHHYFVFLVCRKVSLELKECLKQLEDTSQRIRYITVYTSQRIRYITVYTSLCVSWCKVYFMQRHCCSLCVRVVVSVAMDMTHTSGSFALRQSVSGKWPLASVYASWNSSRLYLGCLMIRSVVRLGVLLICLLYFRAIICKSMLMLSNHSHPHTVLTSFPQYTAGKAAVDELTDYLKCDYLCHI